MQSSFTAQVDGTYVGNIRTRREPTEVTFVLGLYPYLALLAHLREFFPGQYLPGGVKMRKSVKRPAYEAGGCGAAKTRAKGPPAPTTPSRAPRTGYRLWPPS